MSRDTDEGVRKMSSDTDEEGDHGGLTQAIEAVGSTQVPDGDGVVDLQVILKQDYAENPSSVRQVGILVEENGNTVPHFFFTEVGVTKVVVGSAYRSSCDIELKDKEKVGISNKAVTIHYDSTRQRLSMRSVNKGSVLLGRGQARGTDQVKQHEDVTLYDGDCFEFYGAGVKIRFHHAPQPPSDNTSASSSSSLFSVEGEEEEEANVRKVYHSQSQVHHQKRIARVGSKASKALHRLRNKNLSAKSKHAARKAIRAAQQLSCPSLAGGCHRLDCPFGHLPRVSLPGSSLQGVIKMFKENAPSGRPYGFIRTSDGRDYYFQERHLNDELAGQGVYVGLKCCLIPSQLREKVYHHSLLGFGDEAKYHWRLYVCLC